MKVVKILNKAKMYEDKKGKLRCSSSYYIECDNGKLICIRPVFDNAYSQLDFVAEIRIKEE